MFDSVGRVSRKKNFLRDWLSARREERGQGNVADGGGASRGAEQSKIRGERLRSREETLIDSDVSGNFVSECGILRGRQLRVLFSVFFFFFAETRSLVRVYRLRVHAGPTIFSNFTISMLIEWIEWFSTFLTAFLHCEIDWNIFSSRVSNYEWNVSREFIYKSKEIKDKRVWKASCETLAPTRRNALLRIDLSRRSTDRIPERWIYGREKGDGIKKQSILHSLEVSNDFKSIVD